MSGRRKTGAGYKHVTSFIDNRGKRRWRFQRRGYRSVYLPEPNHPDFLKAYTDALHQVKRGYERQGYTLAKAIDAYLESVHYRGLADGTKPGYYSLLMQIGSAYGHYTLDSLDRANLKRVLDGIESSSKRNRVLSMFRLILDEAVDAGKLEANLARDFKRAKHKSRGYKTWSRANIAQFADAYPAGSTERLAMFILYYTGQRSSDAVILGRDNITEGRIRLRQKKTGNVVSIPIHPTLANELPNRDVWIINGYGKPFSAKGFQQWFVKRIKRAGLDGLSGHGLRKALATHLSEAGANMQEIAAVLGHSTLTESAKYAKAASQEKLADMAFKRLESI